MSEQPVQATTTRHDQNASIQEVFTEVERSQGEQQRKYIDGVGETLDWVRQHELDTHWDLNEETKNNFTLAV